MINSLLRTGLLLMCVMVTPVTQAATPPEVLVVAKNIGDMISLDPAVATELSSYEVSTNVYQRVMRYDADRLQQLVPDAIEDWSVSADGRTFTMKVRAGLKFASGNPLTAQDIAWSLQRAVLINRVGASFFRPLGWNPDNVRNLVKAVDPARLELSITQDFGPTLVLNILATNVASVLDSKLVMSQEKAGDMGQEWLKTNSAGSGPFRVRSWAANEAVVMERNPNYAGPAPAMSRVVIRHVPESTSQRLLLEKGDVDIARNLSPEQIAAVAKVPGIRTEQWPKGDQYYLGMNQRNPLLANVKVREALRWAIDYQAMTSTFLKGRAQVHQSFWPSGFPGSVEDKPFRFDPERARRLLREGGFPNGIEVVLDVPAQAPLPEIAQAMQATMAEAGIRVKIQQAEARQVISRYRAGQHEIVLIYWSPDYFDPHINANTFARNVDPPGATSFTSVASRNGWVMPELTALTDVARSERNAARRMEMYADLQRRVMKDAPLIFMFQVTEQVALRNEVKGFVNGPNMDTVFYRLVRK